MTLKRIGAALRPKAIIYKLLTLSLLVAGYLTCAAPASAGYSSMVMDANGHVLNEVNADQLNHPASLTKMMTLYLAFEAVKQNRMKLEQPLPVSAWASNKSPTKLDLRPGQSVSLHDCILGMITKSANDAATVVGEAIGGNEANFARIMTTKAHQLGMTSTVFRNASGLPDDAQVTSARDLVKLAQALYRDFPEYYPLFATREFYFRGVVVRGHNHLMERYPGMDGLKTGFTNASGFNLASSAVRGNIRLFGVVMGGQSSWARDELMATLLDDSFAGRSTSPIRVAQAAGVSARSARRLLASLSPIGSAEAATLQPAADSVVSSRYPSSLVKQVAAAAPARRARKPSKTSGFGIQVGAYTKRVQAQHAARTAVKLAHLGGKPIAILTAGHGEARAFRVRVSGLSQEGAQAACRTLHTRGQACAIFS